MVPIVGKRYRCLFCANYDLCATCWNRGAHSTHPFVCTATRGGDWVAVDRAPPVSASVAADLQGRELSTQDYETLLGLDQTG